MVNREWIKNLALSQYDGEQWHIPAQAPDSLGIRAMDQLQHLMNDAVHTFNLHAKSPISIFPLAKNANEYHVGFLLLRGRVQIRLAGNMVGSEFRMVGTTIIAEGYLFKEHNFAKLTAKEDPWGAINWQQAKGSTWTTEQLVRNVFIHLMEQPTRL